MTDLSTSTEPVPRGPLSERTGEITRGWRNYFEGRTRQLGEVISGVNQNRQSIVDLAISVESDLGDLATAYIAADAVVAANADSANATLSTTLTAAFQAGDTAVQSNVTINAGAIASINNTAAFYDIIVAAGANPARIGLKAGASGSSVLLEADQIYFGSQTEFDTSSETFISVTGAVKTRYGSPFGATSNLVRWYGPSSVADGDETLTNGYLAEGTGGERYIGSAAFNWGATAAEAAASNAQLGVGRNAVSDCLFRRLTDSSLWVSTGVGTTSRYSFEGMAAAVRQVTGTPSLYSVLGLYGAGSQKFPVVPGERVEASAFVGGNGLAFIDIYVFWWNSAGAILSTTLAAQQNPVVSGGGSPLSSYTQIGGFVTVPANAVAATWSAYGYTNGATANPYIYTVQPFLARANTVQTQLTRWSPGLDGQPGADVTGGNTAAAIADQGLFALGNYYEQSTDPGTVPNGSMWLKTTTSQLYLRRTGSWGLVATIASAGLSVTPSTPSLSAGAIAPATATTAGTMNAR